MQEVTKKVKKFYEEIPFNYFSTTDSRTIERMNLIKNYPNLHQLVKDNRMTVLDVGCGVGWFTNSIAYHYDIEYATGIDICEKALARAKDASVELHIEDMVEFKNCDLFQLEGKYQLVNSIGVLHHTHNCKEAIKKVCTLVEDGGYLHIGLYHKYGREPFLSLFKGSGEESYQIFRDLNTHIEDEMYLRSWFRDQVQHPHETQHTFKEVHGWLEEFGFEVLSTSINKFETVDYQKIYEDEKDLKNISIKKIKDGQFFPGFFTILAGHQNEREH